MFFSKSIEIPSHAPKAIDECAKQCSQLPKEELASSCVMTAIEKTTDKVYLHKVIDDYIKQCSQLPKEELASSCVIKAIKNTPSDKKVYLHQVIDDYIKQCS